MADTLVFIHGWASSSDIWTGQKEYFGKSYDVICPNISKIKDVKEGAELVRREVCSLDSFILIGWSLGWLVILELLKDLAVKPRGIVSVNATPKFVDDGYLGKGPLKTHLAKVMRDCRRDPEKALEDFYKAMLSDRGKEIFSGFKKEDFDCNYMNYGLKILETADYRDFLREINIPTLFIAGLKDTICPKEASEYMHDKVRTSRIKMLDCGHMPFLTNYQEFNLLLDDFVKGL